MNTALPKYHRSKPNLNNEFRKEKFKTQNGIRGDTEFPHKTGKIWKVKPTQILPSLGKYNNTNINSLISETIQEIETGIISPGLVCNLAIIAKLRRKNEDVCSRWTPEKE